MNINGLEDRIKGLSGVEKKDDGSPGKDGFYIGETEFITDITDSSLVLHLTPICLNKMGTALKSEPRVDSFDEKNNVVRFKFRNDVDREFVFLYIRYAWKYWRTRTEAA